MSGPLVMVISLAEMSNMKNDRLKGDMVVDLESQPRGTVARES